MSQKAVLQGRGLSHACGGNRLLSWLVAGHLHGGRSMHQKVCGQPLRRWLHPSLASAAPLLDGSKTNSLVCPWKRPVAPCRRKLALHCLCKVPVIDSGANAWEAADARLVHTSVIYLGPACHMSVLHLLPGLCLLFPSSLPHSSHCITLYRWTTCHCTSNDDMTLCAYAHHCSRGFSAQGRFVASLTNTCMAWSLEGNCSIGCKVGGRAFSCLGLLSSEVLCRSHDPPGCPARLF